MDEYVDNKEYMLDQMNFERNVKQPVPFFLRVARRSFIFNPLFTFIHSHFYFAPSSSRKKIH